MKTEKIAGIGSIPGGEYESIAIEGIAKLKGKAKAESVNVEGLFKTKGKLEVKTLKIEGIQRTFRDIKAKEVNIDGILKLKRASLLAERIYCFGVITSTNEINADEIALDGICSLANLYGDKVKVDYKASVREKVKLPSKFSLFLKLYFGRSLNFSYNSIDYIECTMLEATNTRFKTIHAQAVTLKDHCRVETLYCDGEINIDKTCVVGKIIKNGKVINKEEEDMPVSTLVKILDLYKNNKITAEEAEKMLLATGVPEKSNNAIEEQLPWVDDGKLRIVAFLGRKLLQKTAPEAKRLEIVLEGEALNVDAYGNLTCGDIKGKATAGSAITCGDIGGNVTAGSSVHCKSVTGKVTAGGGVYIEK